MLKMQDDLAQRRTTLENARIPIVEDLRKIYELDITDDAKEFYQKLIKSDISKLKEIRKQILEIAKLQTHTLTFNHPTYTIKAKPLNISGNEITNPFNEYCFDIIHNDSYIKYKTFYAITCGLEMVLRYKDEHYFIDHMEGTFRPLTISQPITLFSKEKAERKQMNVNEFNQALKNQSTFENIDFIGNFNKWKYDGDDLTFVNCKFDNPKYFFTNNQGTVTNIRLINCEIGSGYYMFYNTYGTKKITIYGSEVTNTAYMFSLCGDAETITLKNFDTSDVTNMKYMFEECRSLSEIDLSTLNTSNVTDMSYMFAYNDSLKTINLSSFDTNKASLKEMFLRTYNIDKFILGENIFSKTEKNHIFLKSRNDDYELENYNIVSQDGLEFFVE